MISIYVSFIRPVSILFKSFRDGPGPVSHVLLSEGKKKVLKYLGKKNLCFSFTTLETVTFEFLPGV